MNRVTLALAATAALASFAAGAQTPADVKLVQEKLSQYGAGTADGTMRPETREAITAYQRDWQIPETGEITPELIARLTGEHPATRPQWHQVRNTPCEVWNDWPRAQEVLTWSGGCASGKANGDGILSYSFVEAGQNKEWIYSGTLRSGKIHGLGVMIQDGGDNKYDGEWQNGKQHGRGVHVVANVGRYEGDWRNGNPHGHGTLVRANGDRYEGEWRDRKQNGQGTLVSAHGDRYEGTWRDGKPHGQGVYASANGDRYEGGFRDGKWNGQGTLVSANGVRYEGTWLDGKPHGQGVMVWADGGRYEGEWRNNKPHGEGARVWPNGVRYEGEWQDDKPHGEGTVIGADGRRVAGRWDQGCLIGEFEQWVINTTNEACGF